jgi:hypothetical protein
MSVILGMKYFTKRKKMRTKMTEENKETQKPTPRMYHIDSEKLMDIMRYLMTRPYGEVVKLMNSLSTLTPVNTDGGKDVGKK